MLIREALRIQAIHLLTELLTSGLFFLVFASWCRERAHIRMDLAVAGVQ